MSIILKQTAFVVEDAREIQMFKKELLKQNTDVFPYEVNKAIYDVSLMLKELSRKRKPDENDIDTIIKLLAKSIELSWVSGKTPSFRKGMKADKKKI
jgi:hypothetical protein